MYFCVIENEFGEKKYFECLPNCVVLSFSMPLYSTFKAMWLMLQRDTPTDYVISTGETTSVRKFVELAFSEVGIEIE